jgi:transketolase
MSRVRDWRWWVVGFCIIVGLFGVAAVGFFIGQWGMSIERTNWNNERAAYIKRFPEVRAETRNACVAEYQDKVQQLQQQNQQSAQSLADLKSQMNETHELAAYTLRFLGDRAKLTDQRSAAMLKQTKVAAAAAVDAKETVEKVDQKVNVAVVKADEAASAVKSVGKKLETATHPTAAVPPTPWAGSRR